MVVGNSPLGQSLACKQSLTNMSKGGFHITQRFFKKNLENRKRYAYYYGKIPSEVRIIGTGTAY
jgi:hypothetical protein